MVCAYFYHICKEGLSQHGFNDLSKQGNVLFRFKIVKEVFSALHILWQIYEKIHKNSI